MAAAGPGPGPGAGGKVKALALMLQDETRRGGYCSGDTVSGRVLLELAGPLPLRGLRLGAAGRARVAWSEAAGSVGAAGACGAEAAAGPRREAEVRYLDVRQSLLPSAAEGERGGGGRRCGTAAPRAGSFSRLFRSQRRPDALRGSGVRRLTEPRCATRGSAEHLQHTALCKRLSAGKSCRAVGSAVTAGPRWLH